MDLTTDGWDYEAIFTALERVARTTQPLHARCRRVVTKEALTQELPELLQRGLAA